MAQQRAQQTTLRAPRREPSILTETELAQAAGGGDGGPGSPGDGNGEAPDSGKAVPILF
jgi:hypothetical protein